MESVNRKDKYLMVLMSVQNVNMLCMKNVPILNVKNNDFILKANIHCGLRAAYILAKIAFSLILFFILFFEKILL